MVNQCIMLHLSLANINSSLTCYTYCLIYSSCNPQQSGSSIATLTSIDIQVVTYCVYSALENKTTGKSNRTSKVWNLVSLWASAFRNDYFTSCNNYKLNPSHYIDHLHSSIYWVKHWWSPCKINYLFPSLLTQEKIKWLRIINFIPVTFWTFLRAYLIYSFSAYNSFSLFWELFLNIF